MLPVAHIFGLQPKKGELPTRKQRRICSGSCTQTQPMLSKNKFRLAHGKQRGRQGGHREGRLEAKGATSQVKRRVYSVVASVADVERWWSFRAVRLSFSVESLLRVWAWLSPFFCLFVVDMPQGWSILKGQSFWREVVRTVMEGTRAFVTVRCGSHHRDAQGVEKTSANRVFFFFR